MMDEIKNKKNQENDKKKTKKIVMKIKRTKLDTKIK
jgi:hypothetical protein